MADQINGADLRRARESKGWGLEKLAGKIGVTKSHLSKVERGIDGRQVTDQLIQAYKDALRLPGIPIPQDTSSSTDQLDARHAAAASPDAAVTHTPTTGADASGSMPKLVAVEKDWPVPDAAAGPAVGASQAAQADLAEHLEAAQPSGGCTSEHAADNVEAMRRRAFVGAMTATTLGARQGPGGACATLSTRGRATPYGGQTDNLWYVDVRAADEGTGMHKEMAMVAEESARFVRRGSGTVGQEVLDQLDADVRQLAREFLVRPPYVMFRSLSSLRSEVFELLEERQRPTVLPGLYRAAGQLCALLAHACSDLGQAYAAETHTRTAWLCADLAEDDQLRAYVRWLQSNVAYWSGDYRRAAELARAGQRFATAGTSLLRLASQEARAHAAAADLQEVERSLAVVSAARDHEPQAADDPDGVFRFDPGKAAYYASEVRLALGGDDNNRKAAADARMALDLFVAQPEKDRCPEFIAAAQLDLVAAHLASHDLDAVAQHLQPVLHLSTESRTLPVVHRVANIGRALAGTPFIGSMLSGELRECIELFCAYPAARELPALPN